MLCVCSMCNDQTEILSINVALSPINVWNMLTAVCHSTRMTLTSSNTCCIVFPHMVLTTLMKHVVVFGNLFLCMTITQFMFII